MAILYDLLIPEIAVAPHPQTDIRGLSYRFLHTGLGTHRHLHVGSRQQTSAFETSHYSPDMTPSYPQHKSSQFKQLLRSPQLEFICEAHNGLSAKIVEEAGFQGIWASGLSISAQFGVRDNNEASWTQILDNLEFMSDATRIPILLDGDTGYGNFNNMQRLIRKLEQRQIAAVCIEDKLFPKTNSFLKGQAQPLAEME